MAKTHFNNIHGYDEDGTTQIMPDLARLDCREAYLFARECGLPCNQHVHIDVPDTITAEDQRAVYRKLVNKLRVHAKENGFKAVMIMVRASDPTTHQSATIDFLMHVPDALQARFKKVVEKWDFCPKVRSASYDETVLPDGTVQSIFNDLFGATSTQFALTHPRIPRKPSGRVVGHRTFNSRHLWLKNRIAFRNQKH